MEGKKRNSLAIKSAKDYLNGLREAARQGTSSENQYFAGDVKDTFCSQGYDLNCYPENTSVIAPPVFHLSKVYFQTPLYEEFPLLLPYHPG